MTYFLHLLAISMDGIFVYATLVSQYMVYDMENGTVMELAPLKSQSDLLSTEVQQLVKEVGVLEVGHATTEDNFTRFKQESATFTARIVMLEEHIKEIESRGEG